MPAHAPRQAEFEKVASERHEEISTSIAYLGIRILLSSLTPFLIPHSFSMSRCILRTPPEFVFRRASSPLCNTRSVIRSSTNLHSPPSDQELDPLNPNHAHFIWRQREQYRPSDYHPGLVIDDLNAIKYAIFPTTASNVEAPTLIDARSTDLRLCFNSVAKAHWKGLLPTSKVVEDLRNCVNRTIKTAKDGDLFEQALPALRGCLVLNGRTNTSDALAFLRLYNSFISRLRRLDCMLSISSVWLGLVLAIQARSPDALIRYLNLSHEFAGGASITERHTKLLTSLNAWLAEESALRALDTSDWHAIRRQDALMTVLTGHNYVKGIRQDDPPNLPSVYNLVSSGRAGLLSYIKLLGHFKGCDELLKSEALRIHSAIKETPDEVREAFINAFLDIGHPEEAWKASFSEEADVTSLSEATWERLLDYPEHITWWPKGISKIILGKLDSYMRAAESSLLEANSIAAEGLGDLDEAISREREIELENKENIDSQ